MEPNVANNLSEGMHSDNDQNAQPPNTYRDSLNGDIITYGGNRFAWEDFKGTSTSFSIPAHSTGAAVGSTIQKPFYPIGWVSFPEYLIVLSANDQSSTVIDGEIGKVTFSNDGIGTYTPLYYHAGLEFTKEHPIAHDMIIAKPENENIKRIVWTDNYKYFRTLNVADSRLTTYIASGSLVVGKQYMVLTRNTNGRVTHNGVIYGAGQAGGSVFTAANTNYTTSGSVYVIEYIPIESLNVSLDFIPGNINLIGWNIGGNLLAGSYQYFYQLETASGNTSNYSYLSLPVHNITDVIPNNSSLQYATYTAIKSGENTRKSLNFTIDSVDNVVYTKIRVGYILCTADGVYTTPKVFLYQTLTGNSFDFTHFGNEVILQNLTLDDITTSNAVLDVVKSICTTKNILFVTNVGLSKDPVFDLSSTTIKCIQNLMTSDQGTYLTIDSTKDIADLFGIFGHAPLSASNAYAYKYQWYEVVGSTGGCTHNAVLYTPGQFFQGLGLVITNSGDSVAKAVIRIKKYTPASSLNPDTAYRNIRIENDWADHKGLMNTHYLKGYWGGETYRFGLFVYGKKGQQNYVQFLRDKEIPQRWKLAADTDPDGNVIGFDVRVSEYDGTVNNEHLSLRSLGLNFSNIDFNEIASAFGVAVADLDTVVSGFSIVRLERDSQIQSQGFLYPNMINELSTSETECLAVDVIYDTVLRGGVGDENYNGAAAPYGRRVNSYMYYSPDDLSGFDNRPNAITGDYLQIVDHFAGYNQSEPTGIYLEGTRANFVEKWYQPTGGAPANDIYSRSGVVNLNTSNTVYVDTAALGVSSLGLPGIFNNRGRVSVNTIGPGSPLSVGYGCKGVLVNTTNAESGGTVLGVGGSGLTAYNKVTVNWVRLKSNLYGGTDDSVKATHKYIYCGHYQALDSSFMSYMTGTSGGKGAGIVNDVEVWGGDCFSALFGFARMSISDTTYAANEFSHGDVVPVECNINENWRGLIDPADGGIKVRTYNKDRSYNDASATIGIYTAKPESFKFDLSNLAREKEYFFLGRPQNFVGSVRDENIVLYSLQKINGEIRNSWNIFLTNNYQHSDSQFGAINNIRAKGARLFYWQDKGLGYMPVFEREMQSSALGLATQLGVGGILNRQDEVDYWYGNQHQFSLMEGEDSWLWFDWRRKTILRMSFSGEKQLASQVKGLDAFFQTRFDSVETVSPALSIFNSDNPLTGKGIFSYYDQRFKRGIMCFRYTELETSGIFYTGREIERDFAILFSKALDKFTGFTSMIPQHMVNHNGHLALAIRQIRQGILIDTDYALEDQVYSSIDFSNYVCILAYNSGGAGTDPSLDPTHWAKTGTINEVHVAWRGNICKFFGKVYESYLSVIVKPDGEAMTVDNVELTGNDTRQTDVYTSNSTQTAQDINITSTNKNYQYIDGSWWFNLPLTNRNARLSDSWTQIKVRVKNWTTTPITSTNLVKRIFSIKSATRKKQ